jgi:hypothetical protein
MYFAIFFLASGVLSLLLFGLSLVPGPRTPRQQLEFYTRQRGRAILSAALTLTWAVTSVPFAVGLGYMLQPGGGSVALSATLLVSGGVLLLGFALFLTTGAFLSMVQPGESDLEQNYMNQQATTWSSLRYFLTDPGLMTMGLGQLTFGWLALQGTLFPSWLSIIGIVGGVAGMLTLIVFRTPWLALVQTAAFALWGLGALAILLANPSLLP